MEKEGHLLFTDGSSLGNPGPGGWGAILILAGERVIEMGGHEDQTTNNRMELVGLIEGLHRLAQESGDITVYIDSSYVLKGATEWIVGWQKRNWKTIGKTDVSNRDLWEALMPLLEERKKFGHIIWKHIPGHAGIEGNERADEIATGYAANADVDLFSGNLGDYAYDIMNIAADDEALRKKAASRTHSRAPAYSYLSLVGGVAKRHITWGDCERRVKGKSGVKYKKTLSESDEAAILRSWGATL